MTFRIFSRKHNLYTNSPQYSSSEWSLSPDGDVIELINAGAYGYSIIKHDKRNFLIEPWTGIFDIYGKKIYRGDIVGAKYGPHNEHEDPDFLAKIIWENGSFCTEDNTGWTNSAYEDAKIWKNLFVKGTIHGVEYND